MGTKNDTTPSPEKSTYCVVFGEIRGNPPCEHKHKEDGRVKLSFQGESENAVYILVFEYMFASEEGYEGATYRVPKEALACWDEGGIEFLGSRNEVMETWPLMGLFGSSKV